MEHAITTGFVTAKDGAVIGYHQLGQGPGLVVLHGAFETGKSHIQLADALAPHFTVYLPDRRGRGLSGSFATDYCIDKEVEDMDILLAHTGANYVFGVSSGAIIWLKAALTLPAIHRAALYEPAMSVNGSVSTDFLDRFDKEIAAGQVTAALITAMKGAQMGPRIFNILPRWLLELIACMAMNREDKKARPGEVTTRMLAQTLHYDFQLIAEMSGQLIADANRSSVPFENIRAEILLLGGSKSPAYLKLALDHLKKLLSPVKCLVIPGVGHGGSGNVNRGGKPGIVAEELVKFYNGRR
jgi:pimeloyl-ACP methyl ester carboxylesterase